LTDALPPNTCPRRLELGAYRAGETGKDGIRLDATCSYCGSITEEAFLAACVRGDQLGPTDKSYKVYVDLPEGEPDRLRVLSHATFLPSNSGERYVRGADLSEEQRAIVQQEGITFREDDYYQFAPRGSIKHAKFYFQHLTQAGCEKFIELLNAKRLNIGYPGRFYVLPFFCVPVKEDPASP
jgi:hypothetical protein